MYRNRLALYHTMSYILLFLFLFSSLSLSQEIEFTVRIYFKEGDPIIINNFTDSGDKFYDGVWKGGWIKLFFKDINMIDFIKRTPIQGEYEVKVILKDGKTDVFTIFPRVMLGESKFGKWNRSYENVSKIEFISPGASPISVSSNSSESDQIILKNGDIVSGNVKNNVFTLRASYATLKFETEKIQSINFEGGGKNRDVVTLRIGDKLSGVIEEDSIRVLMRSDNEEVLLDKDKIKDIHFRE